MPDQTITCPHCNRDISLTETLVSQIAEVERRKFKAEADAKEAELKRREAGLKDREKAVDGEVEKRLAAEKKGLAEEARKKAEDALAVEINALKEESAEKAKRLEEARTAELELRRKARALEEEKKALDLKVERTLDAEREKIRQETLSVFSDEHRLKDMEKEKKISDMLKTIEELKRKGEQGSMQTQGEVLELELEELLRQRFPVDTIEPVPKGIRGADVIQRVHTRAGQYCGSIIWESKRTKAWNDDWLVKLKDDQREIKAEVAVIVTETLPKDLGAAFGRVDGVWITGFPLAGALADTLRTSLADLAQARSAAAGKGEKMEDIYNYVSGPEFKHKVEAIVEAFKAMKDDLDKEKNAMTRIWAKREKQIERVVTNIVRMRGEMQGIIGATLPEIKSLELASGKEEEPGDED
jgi:hypothetical protein